ncbi:MAG: GNAT family N-acetyltransferase [Candidatus Bathyarchaeota archaeon]|nr:GNAT family N-acetyltransferase [Candidatus Bathyarchaeota archaeon]
MNITKVTSQPLLRACRKFLARNPIANVLPLGDIYSPLLQVSDIYSATSNNHVIGVSAVYHGFSTPSIVFGVAEPKIKQALLKKAINEIPNDFISLCQPHETNLFKEHATIRDSHFEQQMIAYPPKHIRCNNINATKISKNEFELLNKFYVEHHAKAWAPIQFRAGPYYCVKYNGKIVSVAGVHLATPQIVQLGNILTDEAYRNRGFATACTNELAANLAAKGKIISLFVGIDNVPAIRIYKKLGFSKARNIAFLVMKRN